VKEPYSFDQPAYASCKAGDPTAMDRRHIFVLHEILMAWPFKNVLEIGCHMGASSTAFVEAMNAGAQFGTTFCDVVVRDSLWSVLKNGTPEVQKRSLVCQQPSWWVLDTKDEFDFIFVDGAHDMDSVSVEVKKLLRRQPLCIMAHDTNATAVGHPACEGAKFLKDTFWCLPGYRCMEDCERRPGEATHRGLFFATTNSELAWRAAEIFAEVGAWQMGSSSESRLTTVG
jgi:hypothetical protein